MAKSRVIAIVAVVTVIVLALYIFVVPRKPISQMTQVPAPSMPSPSPMPSPLAVQLPEAPARIIAVPKLPKQKLGGAKKSAPKSSSYSALDELEALATGESVKPQKLAKNARHPAEVHSHSNEISDAAWLQRPQTGNVKAEEAIETIRRYDKAVVALENGQNKNSVEFVYQIGRRAASDLMFVEKHVIDQQAFEGIKVKMKKLFIFNQEELFKVYANDQAFLDLAQNYGNLPKDVNYFQIALANLKDGRPIYSKRTTEYYDCVNYGSGRLSKAYQAWTNYQNLFPGSYKSFVQDEILDAQKALVENKCACGNEKDIKKEFKKFGELFPESPLNTTLKIRLSKLKQQDQLEFRLQCKGF